MDKLLTIDRRAAIGGRVTRPDGTPVASAKVKAGAAFADAVTRADGKFVFWDLPDGAYAVSAADLRGASTAQDVEARVQRDEAGALQLVWLDLILSPAQRKPARTAEGERR
jgi:hypothetical protein